MSIFNLAPRRCPPFMGQVGRKREEIGEGKSHGYINRVFNSHQHCRLHLRGENWSCGLAYWCVIAVNGGFVRGTRRRKGNQREVGP